MILVGIGYILAVLLVLVALAYRRLAYWQSNVPSPGLFFFREKSGKGPNDLKNFCEKNKAGMVQGWIVTKTNNIVASVLSAESNIMATHPDTAQIVLRDEESFVKQAEGFGDWGDLAKESLGILNGAEYKKARDLISPSFHFGFIKQFVPVFQKKTQDLFNVWTANGLKDIDLYSEMGHFTVDSMGIYAFNIDFDAVHGGIHDYINAYHYLMRRDIPKTKRGLDEVKQYLTKMTQNIVEQKKKAGAQAEKDFLDRLLTDETLTASQLRDHVFGIFLAGHETTAASLTWALHNLANYPEHQQTAREEVDRELKGAIPDADNVKALTFMDCFIKESMRQTAGTFSSREAVKDIHVGKYFIPKGTKVGLSMYTIHHLEEFWPEPHKFDPYRFTEERSKGRHPFAYMPFSLGRRMCIGNSFSLLEQRIFLAMLLQQFTIEKSEKCVQKPFTIWQGILPMGIRVTAVPRQKV